MTDKPITVGELIEKLRTFDSNLPVRINCPDDYRCYYPTASDIDTDDENEEVVFFGSFIA